MAMGTVISLPFSGILADTLGWESVFYVQGGLSIIWCFLWVIFVYDTPEDHPRIHPDELELFVASAEQKTTSVDQKKSHDNELEENNKNSEVVVPILFKTLENKELNPVNKAHSVLLILLYNLKTSYCND